MGLGNGGGTRVVVTIGVGEGIGGAGVGLNIHADNAAARMATPTSHKARPDVLLECVRFNTRKPVNIIFRFLLMVFSSIRTPFYAPLQPGQSLLPLLR